MYIPLAGLVDLDFCAYSTSFWTELSLYLAKMSLQKKNVIQGFMKDEYVPTPEQFLVKYVSGKGNNLHEVECSDGTTILASMPKKYRQTVWLKKDDCLVIDPIEEGKKVKGEIICLLPDHAVRDLITNRQWPRSDPNSSSLTDVDALLKFFERSSDRKSRQEDYNPFPSSDSSDVETEEEDEDEADDDNDDAVEGENVNNPEKTNETANGVDASNDNGEDVDDVTRDRNRSRVQLVTSGIVTVTNVLSEGFENDIQSLEFEAEEDDETAVNNRDVNRHTNTIRIQVNYNNAN